MERSKQISVRKPIGGMDRDRELSRIDPANYQYANNIDGGYGKSVEGIVPHDGTTEIPYTLPVGSTYVSIGLFENLRDSSLIEFLADTTNEEHLILEYKGGQVGRLLQGSFLNFSPDARVHSAAFVDGDIYWSDGVDLEGTIEGNPPRHINLERHREGKFIRYEMIVNTDAMTIGTQFSYEITDLDGNNVSGPTLFLTLPASGPPYDGPMLALFNALDTAGFEVTPFDVNTSTNPARVLKFYWPAVDLRVKITVSGGTGTPEIQLNEVNFYPLPADTVDFDEQITVIKPAPTYPPAVEFRKDASVGRSGVWGRSFKFRYRYIFVGGEQSAWSPYSLVPTNFYHATEAQLATNDKEFNVIRITPNAVAPTADKYLQQGWRHLVRKIEFAVYASDSGILTSIETYDLNDFYIDQLYIDFTNIQLYSAVPSDDNAEPDVQALKNFDYVPKIAMGLENVYDEQGNSILVLGGGSFDYDIVNRLVSNATVTNPAITPPFGDPQESDNKGLKYGGLYIAGVVFKDKWGRCSAVQDPQEISVPFTWFTRDISPNVTWKQYYLQYNLATTMPDWAVAWQPVLTKNLNQARYFQYKTQDCRNFTIRADADSIGTFEPFPTHIGWAIDVDDDSPVNAILFKVKESSGKIFVPEINDRLHVLYWEGGSFTGFNNPDPLDAEDYDYAVAGYVYYDDKFFVLIDYDTENPVNFGNHLLDPTTYSIEVYTPQSAPVSDIFYEFGPAFPILPGGITDRTPLLLEYGDTYIGSYEISVPQFESATSSIESFPGSERPTLHPTDQDPLGDHGRAMVYDPEYKERYLKNLIRFSDVSTEESSIRGASSFRGTNFIKVPGKWGPIRKLVLNQNVLLAIMSSKTQPIYVAKDRLMDLSGAALVGRTSRVFNIADEVMLDLGTLLPESVVYEQGKTFGFDCRTGRYWRYTSGGGQVPISDNGMISTFRGYGSGIMEGDTRGVHIIAGWRRSTETLYVRYGVSSVLYKNMEGVWKSFTNMAYDSMANLGVETYVMKGGALWMIDSAAEKAKYFDTQYGVQIDFVLNDAPEVMKIYDALEITARNQWYVLDVDVAATPSYPSGMQSEIPLNKFALYEGRQKAPFLRDKGDPSYEFVSIVDNAERDVTALLRGRLLRGDVMVIRARQADPSIGGTFRELVVFWRPSEVIVKQ